jgi:hypothetical protein
MTDDLPGEVQLSLDGMQWTTIALTPASASWLPVEIDLSPWVGHVVHMRSAPTSWRLEEMRVEIKRP